MNLDKENTFEYKFMDDAFDSQYKAENNLANIFKMFTSISILLACLGLFGLAAFSVSRHTKEIGIRKVLGADVINILSTVTVRFLNPVMIAILIAIPISWIAMKSWLQDFPYRTPISPGDFLWSALVAFLVAVLTVSFHAITAAISNPVKSLRNE